MYRILKLYCISVNHSIVHINDPPLSHPSTLSICSRISKIVFMPEFIHFYRFKIVIYFAKIITYLKILKKMYLIYFYFLYFVNISSLCGSTLISKFENIKLGTIFHKKYYLNISDKISGL